MESHGLILALSWFSPSHCGHLGSEPVDGRYNIYYMASGSLRSLNWAVQPTTVLTLEMREVWGRVNLQDTIHEYRANPVATVKIQLCFFPTSKQRFPVAVRQMYFSMNYS